MAYHKQDMISFDVKTNVEAKPTHFKLIVIKKLK
jgi:hypothetical protein